MEKMKENSVVAEDKRISAFAHLLRSVYKLSSSRGDFSGVGDIHFFYSSDEVLYGALPDFEEACKRANVPYTAFARPRMVYCCCMLPYFKEVREDFDKITEILKMRLEQCYEIL